MYYTLTPCIPNWPHTHEQPILANRIAREWQPNLSEHPEVLVWYNLCEVPVEQTRGQRQTGHNDLPGKGERVAKWMVRVESKKC